MSFEVIPASVPVRTDEWDRALKAPASELPPLSDLDQEFVRRWKMDADSYRRRKLLVRKYVMERQARQGASFGEFIERLLQPLGRGYVLQSVIRQGEGWTLTIRNAQGDLFVFHSLLAVVEALADGTATKAERAGFRDNLLEELARQDALEAAS